VNESWREREGERERERGRGRGGKRERKKGERKEINQANTESNKLV